MNKNSLSHDDYMFALNKYGHDWQYVIDIYPFATDDDIDVFISFNAYDLLIIFKNGDQYLINTLRHTRKKLNVYTNGELTEEQWTKEYGERLKDLLDRRYLRSAMVS